MKIVAFPAYNEELYIGSLVLQAKRYVDKVIVLDDGSKDNTRVIAERAGALVVRQETNQGKGSAIQLIFEMAKGMQCDVLVLMDADGQHLTNEIPLLIESIECGNDIAIGTRHNDEIPFYRRVGQTILTRLTRFTGGHARDSQSGFRAFNRKAINDLELTEYGFAIESEMLVLAKELNLVISEVPISVIYHNDGSTMNPVTHGLSVVESLIEMVAERRPLFFFGSTSLILYIAGSIFGYRALHTFLTTAKWALGTALLSVLLIIIATVVLFCGIMLFAISRWKNKRK